MVWSILFQSLDRRPLEQSGPVQNQSGPGGPQSLDQTAATLRPLDVVSGHHFSILSLSLRPHHLTDYLTYHLTCTPNLAPHDWGAHDHSHDPVTNLNYRLHT